MGNMSYCRFENTASDLYDCTEVMNEVWRGDKSVLYLNSTEQSSFEHMAKLCREYLDMYEWIVAANLVTDKYDDARLRSDDY